MEILNDTNPVDVGDRAFVFGGAYGNLQATQAILETADNLGFRSHQIVFTGDLVAYCGEPAETVQLIRDAGIHIIQGNCEESLGADANDCGCGFEDDSTCNLLSAQWYSFCKRRIDAETCTWMHQLPRSLWLKIGDFHFGCLHGTQNAINEFVFPS